MPKPTASDIAAAIEIIEADEWIDPLGLAPTHWSCELYNPENRLVGDGIADTPGVAHGTGVDSCLVRQPAPDTVDGRSLVERP